MVAKTFDCTFLLIRHLTKDPKGRSIYRGQGPMSIIGGARHALLAGCDPNDSTRRLLAVNKSNLASEDSVRGYEIVLEKRRIKGKWVEIPKISWTETDLTKFMITARERLEAVSQLEEAVEFLEMKLADGRVEQKEVIEAAKREGIKPATLERAKRKLQIKSRKDGFAGVWFWEL